MKAKLHAKLDHDTIILLQRCREITGYRHNDELIKFMAAFVVKSFVDTQARMQNEQEETRHEGVAEREQSALSEPSAGEAGGSGGRSTDIS